MDKGSMYIFCKNCVSDVLSVGWACIVKLVLQGVLLRVRGEISTCVVSM